MRILAISGSLRRVSTNTTLLRAVMAMAPAGVEIELYAGLGDLPHFNPDLEGAEPPAVLDYRARLQAADGVLISSPEYAHGVPGVLKNALDWVVGSGELVEKPVALLNAAPRSTHAQAQLNEILTVMTARLVAGASVAVPLTGKNLDAAGIVAHPELGPLLATAIAAFVAAIKDKAGAVIHGPVSAEFSVAYPFAEGAFSTRVRLYPGVRRVDITTELVNSAKLVRYQVLFPTSIKNGRNVQEIPFGAVERPVGIEYPAQQWADYSDGQHGVTLLNAGMPGNLVTDGTLMLSLLRSHSIGGYGFGGGYEPGMTSESGYELGRSLTFRYALVPHGGSWQQSAAYRAGLEFNHPLLVRKATSHAGLLPARWGLIEISQPNVVLTAFKPGPGKTTVLRVYEAEGKATPNVKIKLHARITAAHEANLLEDSGRSLHTENDTVQFALHPFEIKTIKLKLDPAKGVRPKSARGKTVAEYGRNAG